MTVDEEGRVLVARIIYGSFIERQGLLRPGDVVLEANGHRITTPEQVSIFRYTLKGLSSGNYMHCSKSEEKFPE